MTEISRNLNANRQTRQITNAMHLMSVSEVRRISGRIEYMNQYIQQLRLTICDILTRSEGIRHSFLPDADFAPKTSAFVVVASDKSLCGAYNQNIINLAVEKIRKCENPLVVTVGDRGEIMLRGRGIHIAIKWEIYTSDVSSDNASMLADYLIDRYLNCVFDDLYLIFTRYHNQLHQEAVCTRLFPLVLEYFSNKLTADMTIPDKGELLYEASLRSAFETLVNEYSTGILYSALMQSSMSEHIARMNAMQSSTKNADKMLASLQLQYNSARQLAITNEITEIAGASLANKHST